jgi:hypothetical protein
MFCIATFLNTEDSEGGRGASYVWVNAVFLILRSRQDLRAIHCEDGRWN